MGGISGCFAFLQMGMSGGFTKTRKINSYFNSATPKFAPIVCTGCLWENNIASNTDMAQLLTEAEIKQKTSNLSGWTLENGSKLICECKFADFIQAMDFVNKLIEPAESAGHHPDIYISYNTVKIQLTTHDAGGLTQKDVDLAQVISAIA